MFAAMFALMMQATGSSGAELLSDPEWTRRPSSLEATDYYPNKAEVMTVTGRAMVACTIQSDGAPSGCRVIEEWPRGFEFGAAALKLARYYRVRPSFPDGRSAVGAGVIIPMRFGPPGLIDNLSAMIDCYGQAASQPPESGEPDTAQAYGFFAAQIALREADAGASPEAFEYNLRSSRASAARQGSKPENGAGLRTCMALFRQSKGSAGSSARR